MTPQTHCEKVVKGLDKARNDFRGDLAPITLFKGIVIKASEENPDLAQDYLRSILIDTQRLCDTWMKNEKFINALNTIELLSMLIPQDEVTAKVFAVMRKKMYRMIILKKIKDILK